MVTSLNLPNILKKVLNVCEVSRGKAVECSNTVVVELKQGTPNIRHLILDPGFLK